MVTLNINGHDHSVDVPSDTPLLWVIREHLQMTGTKFGCGAGLCGACTVHLNGEAVRSCQTAVSQASGKKNHHHRRS
jgi:isoquinoline 1-oxidoreductase alpha subunit